MNYDQLSAARAALWHQNSDAVSNHALLTIEAAGDWLAQTGICSFAPPSDAPRKPGKRATAHAGTTSAGLAFPAPSFLEAVLGAKLTETTEAEALATARATAQSLLVRLVAAGDAVLLPPAAIDPATVGIAGTIASSGCFAYVYALRGDRNWRQPPSIFGAQRVSPLAVDAWKQLDLSGPITAFELGRELGREVTEAAALRALGELWSQLRVIPVPQLDGAPTKWETAGHRHKQALQTAANASAPMALSGLISLYLQSVIAASEEEIANFLQPLAPSNRVLEVVHGLQAARQLDPAVCEGQRLLHVAGMLPEFADMTAPAAENVAPDSISAEAEALESLPGLSVLQQASAFPETEDDQAEGSSEAAPKKAYAKKPYERKSGGRESGGFTSGPRKPFEKKPYERKPYGTRATGAGAKPAAGGWKPDEGFRSERPAKPYAERGSKPFSPRSGGKDFAARGPRKEFTPRSDAPADSVERKSFGSSNPGYDKPGFAKRNPGGFGRQGFAKSGGAAKSGGFKSGGFKPREGGFKPPRKSFGEKPSFGDKPKRFDAKPNSFDDKPSLSKPKRFDDKSSFSKPRRFDERPPRSSTSRPSAGRSGSSYGGSNSKPLFSKSAEKPGGFSKPSGFKSGGFKSGGFKSGGFKSGGFKKREGGEGGFKRSFSGGDDKPKRAYTPRTGSGEGSSRPSGGFKSGGKPGSFSKAGGFSKPGGFKSGGFKPGGKSAGFSKRPATGKGFGGKSFGAKKFSPGKFDKAPRGKKKPEGESRGEE